MNQYGAQARRHWQTFLPERYRQIEDPQTFFTDLGQQITSRIDGLKAGFAGPDPVGETYLEKLGRLNMAELRAREQALHEMLPDPEDEPTTTG